MFGVWHEISYLVSGSSTPKHQTPNTKHSRKKDVIRLDYETVIVSPFYPASLKPDRKKEEAASRAFSPRWASPKLIVSELFKDASNRILGMRVEADQFIGDLGIGAVGDHFGQGLIDGFD